MLLCAALDAWVLSTVLTACASVVLQPLLSSVLHPKPLRLMADGALMLIAHVRERERECMFYTRSICGANVDDYEADYLDFEAGEISDSDLM